MVPKGLSPEYSDEYAGCEWSQPYAVYDLPNGSRPGSYALSVQLGTQVMTSTWQVVLCVSH